MDYKDGNKIEYDAEGNKISSTPTVTHQVEGKYKDLLMFCTELKTRTE